MTFKLTITPVEGPKVILDNGNVTSVEFSSEGPKKDRNEDRDNTMVVKGIINNTEAQSITIDHFILMVGRHMFAGVEVEMYNEDGKLLRKINCNDCFIEYEEHFEGEEGDGTFTLWAKQHPSSNDEIVVEMDDMEIGGLENGNYDRI